MIFAESYYSIHSYNDSEQHKRFVFHDKNDQQFLISGVNSVNWDDEGRAYPPNPGDEGTNNWGIVNPKMLPDAPWTDSKDPETQYQKLHEVLGKLNACAQLNFGTSVWNGQPYSCTNP